MNHITTNVYVSNYYPHISLFPYLLLLQFKILPQTKISIFDRSKKKSNNKTLIQLQRWENLCRYISDTVEHQFLPCFGSWLHWHLSFGFSVAAFNPEAFRAVWISQFIFIWKVFHNQWRWLYENNSCALFVQISFIRLFVLIRIFILIRIFVLIRNSLISNFLY